MPNSKTVFVIDDDPDILWVVTRIVSKDGYRVKSATNGLEALELIAQEGLPDLILLDMRMPIMDGWDFTNKFFSQYGHKIPIIVVTAAGSAEERADGVGADGWLAKPFEMESLRSTIRKHLEL